MHDLLALYGTLMSGLARRPGAPELEGHIEPLGACALEGVLYDAGPYPGLTSGEGRVRGELWRCVSPAALEILDAWEDYRPAAPEESPYVRRRVRLITPDCDAWVYYWNLPTAGMPVIPSGDWRAHVAARRVGEK